MVKKPGIQGILCQNIFQVIKSILWIDADAWVNSWYSLLNCILEGCENKKLAIATSADRSYGRVLRAEWVLGSFARIKSQNYKHARIIRIFRKNCERGSFKASFKYRSFFAGDEDAPHWDIWQKNLKKALKSQEKYGDQNKLQ